MSTDIEQQLRKLSDWFTERPQWVQHAAACLVDGIDPRLEDLVALVKHQAGIATTDSVARRPLTLPHHLVTASTSSVELHLDAIDGVSGVNALAPKCALVFGEGNLTVVYGDNGTGKSGYVRLLKHACGARELGNLHLNVRLTGASHPSATFRYSVNGKREQRSWRQGDLPSVPLSLTELYDADCGDVYATEDHVLIYEPPLLLLFGRLVTLAEQVDAALAGESRTTRIEKIPLPTEYSATESGRWYQRISHATKPEEIAANTAWSAQDQKDIDQLRERISADPRKQAETLRAQARQLSEVLRVLSFFIEHVSPDAVLKYWELKADAVAKRKVATESVTAMFRELPLGISSPTWRRMWEVAREFSEATGYPGHAFPHTAAGAHCVLCQQELSATARDRLQSFEDYVRGRIEGEAGAAEQLIEERRKSLISGEFVRSVRDFDALLMAGGMNDETQRRPVLALVHQLSDRKNTLLAETLKPELEGTALDTDALDPLRESIRALEERAKVFEQDAAKEKRGELIKANVALQARKWLHDSTDLVKREHAALVLINALEEARRLASTRGLTEQKNSLAELLISDAYIARFGDEMRVLRASRIDVELVKGSPRKGVVPHEIRIRGASMDAPTDEILSEGERRVVSIAAFLADVTGPNNKTPFIFDDPISSLDQAFEEATVNRLAKLARQRQVIVFTHRLSLVRLLSVAAETEGIDPHILSVERTPDGCGNPEEPPISAKKPKARVNELLQDVQRAKKIIADQGQRAYDAAAQVICTRLRKTLELVVEQVLLRDVVRRYVKDIQTKGKLAQLARLVPADCKFVDELMTKYSGDEHEQPTETPKPLPIADELESDLKALQAWMEEFEKRPNPW